MTVSFDDGLLCALPASIHRAIARLIWRSTMRKPADKTMPTFKTPTPRIEDRGTIRLGNSSVTAEIPPLRRPSAEIADRGTIRLGNSSVTTEFSA